jgi:type VI secretion system protein ImpK
MQRAVARLALVEHSRVQPEGTLVELAVPVFEVLLKLKARLVAPSGDLRRWMGSQLRQFEENGERLGYTHRQLQAAKFALAALADETVLTANFAFRESWEKYPLQLEYFGVQLAGETFFDKVTELLSDAETDAAVIEVYYVCLLLGFRGKYKIDSEERFAAFVTKVEDALERAGRLRTGELAPHWRADDQPEPPAREQRFPRWVKTWGSVALGSVVLLYVILYTILQSELRAALVQLNR